ncbi:MAG: hypothetical protein EBU46_06695 [Nitrosomonadaceae bacterium]|nr:hypothetical protein [Nitrosomonadaceae bacterium]
MTTPIQKNEKTVIIKIADHTGDTELVQKLQEGVETITKQHFEQKKWVFAGARQFQFHATGLDDAAGLLADTIRLREMLEEYEGTPQVFLTGELQGGAR